MITPVFKKSIRLPFVYRHVGTLGGFLRAGFHGSASSSQFNQNAPLIQGETNDDNGTWLHKLDDVQKMFYWGHRYGTRFQLCKLTLNSRKPLSQDLVRQALMYWHRKIPVFQVLVKEHQEDMWFYKPNYMEIDFKAFNEDTPTKDVIDEFLNGFDELKGPLWKARLLPLALDAPCKNMEVKKDYPYQYQLYFCPHHSPSDGRTALSLIQPLLDIINDLVDGKDINDDSPLGVFVSNDEYFMMYKTIRDELMKSPERLEKLKELVTRSNKTPLLFKIFPQPEVSEPGTKHLSLDIDKETVINFVNKCKENGVSGGTGMQMITNVALVEVSQDAGIFEETYDLSAYFITDLRRYMQPRDLHIHGCHSHAMASFITLNKDVRKNFWSNCKSFYEMNFDLIRGREVVKQAIGRQLFLKEQPPNKFFKTRPELSRDYAFNNLQKIDRLIHGRGKNVQITEVIGFNSVHHFIFPFMHVVYNFRDSYGNTFSYSTDCISDENAIVICDKIKSLVVYFSNQ